jgi:hypothetical protein
MNLLIEGKNMTKQSKLMFLWWHSWHLRNNSILTMEHSVEQPALFIQTYLFSFRQVINGELNLDMGRKH